MLTQAMFYFYRTEGHEYVEEIFRPYPAVLSKIVTKMLDRKENKYDEALAICMRNPEVVKYLKNVDKIQNTLSKMQKVVPNSLQTDVFGPSDPKEFLSFADFNMT